MKLFFSVEERKCVGKEVTKKCESWNYKFNKCGCSSLGTIQSVTLHKQESKTMCKEGQNWGYDDNSIWVNDGCRAEFDICVEGRTFLFS